MAHWMWLAGNRVHCCCTHRTPAPCPLPLLQMGKEFYKKMVVDSEYQGQDYDEFASWLTVTNQPTNE